MAVFDFSKRCRSQVKILSSSSGIAKTPFDCCSPSVLDSAAEAYSAIGQSHNLHL